jgi:hypothetical protein
MSNKSIATIATLGIHIGKSSFHVVGLDRRGAIVLRARFVACPDRIRVCTPPLARPLSHIDRSSIELNGHRTYHRLSA